jgi:uncharacterized protein (DUF2132 family)
VIYDRASKQRYQLHIQSGQFADEADTNFGIEKTPKWAREHIVNWYIKNNPQLKLAQMMTLVNFSPKARELLDKQDMGDLGDLISRYGVK